MAEHILSGLHVIAGHMDCVQLPQNSLCVRRIVQELVGNRLIEGRGEEAGDAEDIEALKAEIRALRQAQADRELQFKGQLCTVQIKSPGASLY